MKKIPIVVLPLLYLAGCSSSPVPIHGGSLMEPQKLQGSPVQPVAEMYPVAALPQPAGQSVPNVSEPVPVWENSQIQKVAVDAFVDENGNLHPKSYMYVVTKKGGWNLDAVRKPNNYIPPENSVAPISGFGTSYEKSYTYAANEPQPSVPSSLLLNDTSNIRLTGLTDPNDGEAARSRIDPRTEVAIFDPFVGWVITPKNSMGSTNTLPNVYKLDASRASIPNQFGQVAKPNLGVLTPTQSQQQMPNGIPMPGAPIMQHNLPPLPIQQPPSQPQVAPQGVPPSPVVAPTNNQSDKLFNEF